MRAHHFAALIVVGVALGGCKDKPPPPKPAPQVSVQLDGGVTVVASCENLCDKAMKCMNKQEPGRAESCVAKCENGGRYQAQLRAKMMQMDCAELSSWLSD